MNFIFDIGNVLLDFKPKLYLKKIFNDQSTEEKMLELIFKSDEWAKLDEGLITRKEAIDVFGEREPDYISEIHMTFERLPEMLTPISDTIALLPTIKNAGHKLYYLSNYPKDGVEYIQTSYEFFSLFDGGVFSCDVNVCKPSPMIYHHLLDKYALVPEECVFFDDMEENVVAARDEGINGILFTDAKCVKQYFDTLKNK